MSLSVDIKKKLGDFVLQSRFEIDHGIMGFLGASGCGKSITLKCIAGIVTPDEGNITLNGRVLYDSQARINLPPQERKVGYLFQNYGLFPNMNVKQNVMCGLCREKDKREKERKAQEMIHKMMLEGFEKHKPSQLSGGQQQRVALARILVNQPEILLLDEPFSALDTYLRLQLETETKDILQEYGRDSILVSHNRDEVYRICDMLAIIEHGRILGVGPTKEMFRNPGSVQGAILTGCKNITSAKKISDYEVFAPEWGMTFTTEEEVGDHLKAIGIRAHYFNRKTPHNEGNVCFVEEIEEPFEWIVKFRYQSGEANTTPVWWRIPKDKYFHNFPEKLGVAPANIMLLYE